MKRVAVRFAAALLATIVSSWPPGAADPSLTAGLTAGRWDIVEMSGKRVQPPATLNFTRVRWLGLNTACGPSWGWYRLSGATLRIHITGNGRFQAGSAPQCRGVDYQLLLGRVRSFDRDGDRLTFLNSDGKAIARLMQTK